MQANALARKLPRWRGFNLLEKFNVNRNAPYLESDLVWIKDWGFDFVRLPNSYHCWTDPTKPYDYDEKVLKEIDQLIEWAGKYEIHVSLNLHRAPGYTVAEPAEKLNLWKDAEAQKQFNAQWAMFAKRYKGVPASRLSFDLVNEPAKIDEASYVKVARSAIAAIREADPDRLIVSDGLNWGNTPIMSLADAGIAQSTRGYQPMGVSHYKASWVNGENWPKPTWPLKTSRDRDGDGKPDVLDRDYLNKRFIDPWKKLEAKGVGIHVGEWGAFRHTPHDVVLKWAADRLALWKEAGWGWAMWNLRGSFGILNSQRDDVKYEDFKGHKLDRKLLELLQAN